AAIIYWQRGFLTLGDFVLIQAYIFAIFRHVWNFGRTLRAIYQHLADAEDMTEVLETPHEIVDKKRAKKLNIKRAVVEFRNVRFNYKKTREVLDNFDLKIATKQKVALVGPSGAGKTTIVRLLLRQYDVSSGKILIDGQDISRVKLDSLWSNISMVPQDPILFHRSLLENIRYGTPKAGKKDVIRAAKIAHCHKFISEFPEKYDTFVGERGVKLSGGERQRVAIARAILRNTPILVLDEATSSLDSESEMLIQDALDNLMKGKTVIVIAHRLSTIMKMDRIVVIDDGKVVEDGAHKELLNKEKGIYKKLWNLQAGGFISE
ncbi:MAG: ATP-binding cassette domain-containing protein, partial [Candidatus Magasanikbacteria bacterium]|nr:ATP-binding cassette domain-containing protein [Candidatus Magasanikbacteria bacterium]